MMLKPSIVVLSYSSKSFPGSICYSGSKSHLLEAIPLLEDKVNIVLTRAWRWLPSPPKNMGISKVFVNSGGIVERMFVKQIFSEMYLYTPLIIVVMYNEGYIEVDGLRIDIPKCYKMSRRRFYLNSRRTPPTAILLSGRLNDIVNWIRVKSNGVDIEYKHIYKDDKYRIVVLRFSSKNTGNINILIRDVNENICSMFKIPVFKEKIIFKTNAIIIVTEGNKNVLDIGGYWIRV